jgi:hypothetical protein
LKKIEIRYWIKKIEMAGIFDPSRIIYLDVGRLKQLEVLSYFNNLRSLKLGEKSNLDKVF